MSKQGDAGAGIGALLGLLLGGHRYNRRRKEDEEERKRQEELLAEDKRRWEAERARLEANEANRRAQAEGQTQRGMEKEGYTLRPAARTPTAPAGSLGFVAQMANLIPASEGASYYADQPGKWWDKPPEPEMFTLPGTDYQIEAGSPAYERWAVNAEDRAWERANPQPDTLDAYQRANLIDSGRWSPTSTATTYDLDSQLPMHEGRARAVVGDLFSTPPPPGVTQHSRTDITAFKREAAVVADRWAQGQIAGGDNSLAGVDGINQGHPGWQEVYDNALQGLVGGGAPPPDTGGEEMKLGNELTLFAADLAAGKPGAVAEIAWLEDPANPESDIAYAGVVKMLAEAMPQQQPAMERLNPSAELAILLGGLDIQGPEVGWPNAEDMWRRGQVNRGSGGAR